MAERAMEERDCTSPACPGIQMMCPETSSSGCTTFRTFILTVLLGCLTGLAFSLAQWGNVAGQKYGSDDIGVVDLLEYWAAASLYVQGQNPYDEKLVASLQHRVSAGDFIPVRMWNPPLVFPFIVLWGGVPFAVLRIAWLILGIALVLWCALALEKFWCFSRAQKFISRGLLCIFYPLILSLGYGQITPLILTGFVLCLQFNQRDTRISQWQSGVALSVLTLKPHLFFLTGAVLLFQWTVRKRWRPVAGVFCTTALLLLLPLLHQPRIYAYYLEALQSAPPIYWQTPTVGSWLQRLSGVHTLAVRFVPTVVALAVITLLFIRKRDLLASPDAVIWMMPFSLLFSPYGWIYDQLLVLPLMLLIVSRIPRLEPLRRCLLMCGLIAANLLLLLTPATWGQQGALWYPLVMGVMGLSVLNVTKASVLKEA